MKLKNKETALEFPSSSRAYTTREELYKVLSAMEKALCRQHIMWPQEGELPCETQQECSKSDVCRSMAEEVLDFSRTLPKVSSP